MLSLLYFDQENCVVNRCSIKTYEPWNKVGGCINFLGELRLSQAANCAYNAVR